MSEKVLVAMSGGVDSSVAACLMKEAGFDCVGATMQLSDESESGSFLTGAEDARSVADALGIPHYKFNLTEAFQREVIGEFIRAYEDGRTPNPCIICNRELKFGELLLRGRGLGCDYVATGHYARIEQDEKSGRFLLKKAPDAAKDQSYVLHSLTQEQLAHTRFPLGKMSKRKVRAIARERGFVSADKTESQDICFVPGGGYSDFIEASTGKHYPEGDFIDRQGNILGRHKGIIRYTVGQRKGLGLSLGEPMYVLRIDPVANTVTLGKNKELFSATLFANNINLISVERIEAPMRLKAKVRYRHSEQWATAEQPDADTLRVVFDEPQRAITPGQAVVLYDGDVVVGGGTIL